MADTPGLEPEQPTTTAQVPNPQDTIDAAGKPTDLPTTPPTSQQLPQGSPQGQQAPTVLIPQQRKGILGVVDEIMDVLAGKQQRPQTYVDPTTNEVYVQRPPMSRGQQWMKVGAEALIGAAKGYAAGQGAGGQGRAAVAGIESGIQMKKDQDKQAQDEYNQARQQAMDKANLQALKFKNTADTFQFAREQRKATQDEIEWSQKQDDWMEKHGGIRIDGTYNGNDYHTVKVAWPSFLKDHHKDDAIHPVKDFDDDGTVKGAHFWYLDPTAGESYEPPGTTVPHYQLNRDDPEAPGTMVDFTPAGPLKTQEKWQYEAAAENARNEDYKRIQALKDERIKRQEAQANLTLAQTKVANIPLENEILRARAQNEQLTGSKTQLEMTKLQQQIEAGDETAVPTLGEAVARGQTTLDEIKDRKTHDAVSAYVAQHHPNLDQASVELPAADRRLKTLATNAILNADRIESIIRRRPDLLGVVQGRITNGTLYAGTNDKDLGDLVASIGFYSQAATGAHAIRAQAAREDTKEELINGFKNGQDAVFGALAAARNSLGEFANLGKPKGMDGKPYVYGPQQPQQQQKPAPMAGAPPGATMKVPGSDNKLHWSDGTKDLGVVTQ
jgi:hypothetical protein